MGAFIKLSKVLAGAEDDPGGLYFECPGCGCIHGIHHGNGPGPRWEWNGNADAPTFKPSLLVQWDQWEPPATTPEMREKIASGEVVQQKVHKVCHSFVTDGHIQFLTDCTHGLAGKTVPLPDFDRG